jgi:hypothetical protein
MYPLSKAFTISVDMAGENKAAWTKDTNSAAMAEPTAALASGVSWPWRTRTLLCRTSTLTVAVNSNTTHPASQSWTRAAPMGD